eukprot:jgi/Hompol1/5045/HPOL_000736-RA
MAGQNFAIACSQYGEGDRVTVLQFVGGMTGKFITDYLDELNIQHISHRAALLFSHVQLRS